MSLEHFNLRYYEYEVDIALNAAFMLFWNPKNDNIAGEKYSILWGVHFNGSICSLCEAIFVICTFIVLPVFMVLLV
ncbi:hypothetical protein [Citrobacter braakii]|uniref:hypothetical protein n=1 Tax=Citrobacter braakii TaxID=57706 RepID=UPI0039788CB1